LLGTILGRAVCRTNSATQISDYELEFDPSKIEKNGFASVQAACVDFSNLVKCERVACLRVPEQFDMTPPRFTAISIPLSRVAVGVDSLIANPEVEANSFQILKASGLCTNVQWLAGIKTRCNSRNISTEQKVMTKRL
jgi:hypothetical protein